MPWTWPTASRRISARSVGLIRYAVDTLTANPAVALYIDGGHSRWLPAEEIANRLNQVGVSKARGFSLNTSNFYTTAEEIGYGEAVSALTGGAHYVIDTGATAPTRHRRAH